MKFTDSRRLGWDTETTSKYPHEARIVTAAIVVRGGAHPDRTFSWLINPGVPIPPETTRVHGIDDAKAKAEGHEPRAALEDIADKLTAALLHGMPVVAFNTAYDWTVLHCELERHGLPTMADRLQGVTPTLVDPSVIDRELDRYRKGRRNLKAVCEVYGVELEDWHTAEADALAALLLADAVFATCPRLDELMPERMYAMQQAWRREWAAGYEAYLRKTRPDATVSGSWPLAPAQLQGGEV